MAQTLRISDFSQGWIPSDDAINGRKNGLLLMDNLELDRNGALSLTGGAIQLRTGFTAQAHDMYSRFIGATRYDYVAFADGTVFRNSTSIVTGGDPYLTAFGTAFNYVLIASGDKRVKDNGTTVFNLGIQVPSRAPIVTGVNYQTTSPISSASSGATVNQYGSSISYSALSATTSQDGNFTKINYDTSGVAPAAPHNAVITWYNTTPLDWTSYPDGSRQTNNDYMNVDVMGFATLDSRFTGMTIDVILQPGPVSGPYAVTDYYSVFSDGTQDWSNPSGGDTWNFQIPRSAFVRVGGSSAGWESVYAVRVTFNCQDTTRTSIEIYPHGDVTTPNGFCFIGGNASQDAGWWQFAQMNIRNDGTYLAKSQLGPHTGYNSINYGQAVLNLETPTDTQVNQVWVFARSVPVFGGNAALENWMCVAQLTDLTNLAAVAITFSIQDAIDLGITANVNLVSIASSSISDKVISIVGPIQGRWFYFTQTFLYPSDVNDPDIVDASIAIRISGSTSEIILWAVQVSDSIILVGTSVDIYVLTGTFTTLPDGAVDVFYRPLGVKFPPITYDVTVYNGVAFYYATDGWRSIKPTSENVNITTPNIDRIYRNETSLNIYNYYPSATRFQPGQLRIPCTTALNKFWGAGQNIIHVYDFVRQYWRPYGFNDFDAVHALTSTQDGHILLFTADGVLWDLCLYSDKRFNGSNASFDFLTPVFDGGEPYKRKENYSIKLRCYTGGSGTINVMLLKEDGTFATVRQNISSNVTVGATGPLPQEIIFDINQQIQYCKTWQFFVWGTVSDFIFSDIEINYELRPQQLTATRILNQNFGSASLKRVRDWPLVIDTMGNTVNLQIWGDGILLLDKDFSTVNTTPQAPLTVHNFISVDLLATDYSMYLFCANGSFELFQVMPPDIVQTLPAPRLFDQVGPDELFQFGRIKKMEVRLYAGNNTRIPYFIYFNDGTVNTGTLNVTPNVEASYYLGIPKESGGGEVVRIEFGGNTMTDPFYRYYVRLQVQKTGQDTELTWVQLPSLIGKVYGSEFEQQ